MGTSISGGYYIETANMVAILLWRASLENLKMPDWPEGLGFRVSSAAALLHRFRV